MRSLLVKALFAPYTYFLSPALHFLAGPSGGCRFEPTCSRYAQEALVEFGFLRGTLATLHRNARCHPGSPGGLDPVISQRLSFRLRHTGDIRKPSPKEL